MQDYKQGWLDGSLELTDLAYANASENVLFAILILMTPCVLVG